MPDLVVEKDDGTEDKVTTKVTEFTDTNDTKLVSVEAAKTAVDVTVDEWKDVWHKLPKERKKHWVDHNTVPIISKSYQTYLSLKVLFEELDDDNG